MYYIYYQTNYNRKHSDAIANIQHIYNTDHNAMMGIEGEIEFLRALYHSDTSSCDM